MGAGDAGGPPKEGWLEKKGDTLGRLRKRWCAVDPVTCVFRYSEDESGKDAKMLKLAGANCKKEGATDFVLSGNRLDRAHILRAPSAEARDEWVACIEDCALRGLQAAGKGEGPPGDVRVLIYAVDLTSPHHYVEVHGPGDKRPDALAGERDTAGGIIEYFWAYSSPDMAPDLTRWEVLKARTGVGNWVRPEGGELTPGDPKPMKQAEFWAPKYDLKQPYDHSLPAGTIFIRFRFAKVGHVMNWRDPDPATAVGTVDHSDSAWRLVAALRPATPGAELCLPTTTVALGGQAAGARVGRTGSVGAQQGGRWQNADYFTGVAAKTQREVDERLQRVLQCWTEGSEIIPPRGRGGYTSEDLRCMIFKMALTRVPDRASMEDVIDTRAERIARSINSNTFLNAAEGYTKRRMFDKTADAINALEADVWGNGKWRPLGKKMGVPRILRIQSGEQKSDKWRELWEIPEGAEELTVEFGQNMRRLYFDVPEGFCDATCGGVTPRPVQEAREQWNEANQLNPVIWRFKSQPLRHQQTRASLASFLGSDPNNTHLVTNGQTALSSVIKGLPWEVGDRVLLFSNASDSLLKAAGWLVRNRGVELVEVNIKLPCPDKEIISTVDSVLSRYDDARNGVRPVLAMFDHVTPKEGWVMPARELRRLFMSKHGSRDESGTTFRDTISTLIEGTLAVGMLDINVGKIGADWYVGSAHSWMYTCPGVGFIVPAPHKHQCTQPLTVSYCDAGSMKFADLKCEFPGHDKQIPDDEVITLGLQFEKRFEYYGLLDFCTWFSVVEALQFADKICGGWSKIRKYCTKEAKACVETLKKHWGTKPLQDPDKGWDYAMLPVVPLPQQEDLTVNDAAARFVALRLLDRGVTAKVTCPTWEGRPQLCVRVACQIFNTQKDWDMLAKEGLWAMQELRESGRGAQERLSAMPPAQRKDEEAALGDMLP